MRVDQLRLRCQSRGGANIRLLISQLLSCDSGTRGARFVRLALKTVMQHDGGLVDVNLYIHTVKQWTVCCGRTGKNMFQYSAGMSAVVFRKYDNSKTVYASKSELGTQ